MNNTFIKICLLIISVPSVINAQQINEEVNDSRAATGQERNSSINGFVRAGLYSGIDKTDNKIYVPSAFSDLGLKIEARNINNFKASADLRFRFGSEFRKPVNSLDIREAFITVNGKKWDISAGQKIIKWGRADFTNPTAKLSPKNYISRSPDPEDMDLGNILLQGRWYPISKLSVEAVAIPFYRSSTLIIDPVPLPSYVTIHQPDLLMTDKDKFSYAIKAEGHLTGIDLSLSWFDGYDPMPGTTLTKFSLDMAGGFPVPDAELTITPYKIRNLGFDFETTAGSVGLRGEASWRSPYKSYKTYEYVPCEEINWVAGIDYSAGSWRFTGEYSGKYMPGLIPVTVNSFLGTELDYSALAALIAVPGFDMGEYVRQQVASYNRLYNYQIEKTYHSAALRIERDMFYGKMTPSVVSMYNFTSHDLLIKPELKFKPSDGLTVTIGGEYYSGKKGSLFDIVDDFMNCLIVAVRADF